MKTEATASSTALPLYLMAFPDFGDLDIELPKGSRDISYKNDTCPSFIVKRFDDGTCLVLYVDYAKEQDREISEAKRFMLELRRDESEPLSVLLTTEDYSEVLALIANETPPLQGPDARLAVHDAGAGHTAWRMTEPDAPGLFALIYNGSGTAIPSNPESEDLIIAICGEGIADPLRTIEIDGRAGLNRWYKSEVGYEPDSEPGGFLPIQELIGDVAAHMLLRCAEVDADDGSGTESDRS